jgi:hypothetical protein
MGEWFWSWWEVYKANREHIVPLLTFVAAVGVAWAALKQARNSTRQAQTAAAQAEIARKRHEEQIKTDQERADADRQRRITESFTKAVEQLGSDKLQVRLGGIYILERISRESEFDYWPVMETLTAFVREQARWKGEGTASLQAAVRLYENEAPQQPRPRLPTDIAAVLIVIRRRDTRNREREKSQGWRLDLRSTDLRGADLRAAHLDLEKAILVEAHLEEADFRGAHLERANFGGAYLTHLIHEVCQFRSQVSEPTAHSGLAAVAISVPRGCAKNRMISVT